MNYNIDMDQVADAFDALDEQVQKTTKNIQKFVDTAQWLNSRYIYESYGPFKQGQTYQLIREGRDYVVLRSGGKNVFVPQCFIEKNTHRGV